MKKFYKPLSVLLAITMCVSLVVPAFADEEPAPVPTVQEETIENSNTPEVIDPQPETAPEPAPAPTEQEPTEQEPTVQEPTEQKPTEQEPTVQETPGQKPAFGSNTLSDDQGPARAPGLLGLFDHEHDWYFSGKGKNGQEVWKCSKWWCSEEVLKDHAWDTGTIKGNEKEYTCMTQGCGATKTTDLDAYPVYVYVRVNGNTDDINWKNLNGAGWFTIGEITVAGLPNPAGNQSPTEEHVNAAIAAAKNSLSHGGLNGDLDLTDNISWTGSHNTATASGGTEPTTAGLVRSEGANDFRPGNIDKDTWDSFPTWHLNGVLTVSDKYTVTYTDGVEDEEVFKDQEYTAKFGDSTPVFEGTPTREGYIFDGWNPAVAEKVLNNATYVAQWRVKSPETPDLKVEKLALVTGTVKPGDTISYQIVVTNQGSKAVENVVITDVLDSKLEFVSASGRGKSWSSEPANGRYEVGNLDKAGTQTDSHYTLIITAKVKDGATGTIANTATADCDGMPKDNKPSGIANVVVEKFVTLSYNAVNGTGAPESETKAVGTDGKATFTVSSTVPTKEGYEFKGWQKGTSVVTGEIAIDQDTTLYAKWEKEPEKYTVTWSFDEDTPESLEQYLPEGSEHIAGDKVGVTSYGKFRIDGKEYSFNGWTSTPTVTVGEDGTFTMPAANVALVGSWTATELPKPVEQTIYQWLPGYGGTSDVPETTDGAYKRETINAGDPVPEAPEDPTRDGYNFTGWSDGVEDVNKDGVKTVTYTAQWAIKTYTVTFNANGGSAVGSQTVNHGQTATRPTAPSRSGYTFNGWRLADATSDYDFETPVTGDLTLTAQWSQNTTTGGGGGGGTTGGGGGGTGGNNNNNNDNNNDNNNEPVVDVDEPDVPLVDVPDVDVPQTETPEELVEVPEEDVPLADVPKTGDRTGLWRMAALMSAAGLAVLTALERRQRREE